jgi:hypothetical protein
MTDERVERWLWGDDWMDEPPTRQVIYRNKLKLSDGTELDLNELRCPLSLTEPVEPGR